MLIDDFDSAIQLEPMSDNSTEQIGPGNEGDLSFVSDSHETGHDYSFDCNNTEAPDDLLLQQDDVPGSTLSTNLFGEGSTETVGEGIGYRRDEDVDFSQFKVETVNGDGLNHTFHPTFQHTQSEINRHISDAKSDISHAETTIRHHTSIAASKARMGEPHGYENYQVSQSRHELVEARKELYKWEHTKPEK